MANINTFINKSFNDMFESLICPICREFLNTPMQFDCNHLFCSLCIRRSLILKSECPTCRSQQQSNGLKNNRPIEILLKKIIAFKDRFNELIVCSSNNDIINSNDNHKATSNKKRRLLDSIDIYVYCPYCSIRMAVPNLSIHISSCSVIQSSQKTLSIPKRERLAPVTYSLLKLKDLKNLCSKFNLSTFGTQQELAIRHREFVLQWNSSCDMFEPLSAEKIIENVNNANYLHTQKSVSIENNTSSNNFSYLIKLLDLQREKLGLKPHKRKYIE